MKFAIQTLESRLTNKESELNLRNRGSTYNDFNNRQKERLREQISELKKAIQLLTRTKVESY